MKLTEFERLVLSNQYKIMSKLFPEEKEYINLKIQILEEGYELHFSELAEGFCETMSEEESRRVLDILDLYRVLYFSVEKLSIINESTYHKKKVYFPGFDGNNETKEMVYANFFIHKMGRYNELKHSGEYPDYNTHSPTIAQYEKMLAIWRQCGEHCYELDEEQIGNILNSAVYGSIIEK